MTSRSTDVEWVGSTGNLRPGRRGSRVVRPRHLFTAACVLLVPVAGACGDEAGGGPTGNSAPTSRVDDSTDSDRRTTATDRPHPEVLGDKVPFAVLAEERRAIPPEGEANDAALWGVTWSVVADVGDVDDGSAGCVARGEVAEARMRQSWSSAGL